jgi:hypothetical protein
MTAADAVRLVASVVPLVRFLAARRVRLTGAQLSFEPPGLRPMPDGLRDLLTTALRALPTDEPRDWDTFLVLDADEAAWWTVTESSVGGHASPPRRLPRLEPPCPAAFGLAEFLAGVWYAPLGQVVLADWLEDRFGPCAPATALRASEAEPVLGYEDGPVRYDAFRWRLLEADVVCYFSRVIPKRPHLGGFILGLLHRASPGAIPRRWARWLRDGEPARQLAAWMGVELPEEGDAETRVW